MSELEREVIDHLRVFADGPETVFALTGGLAKIIIGVIDRLTGPPEIVNEGPPRRRRAVEHDLGGEG